MQLVEIFLSLFGSSVDSFKKLAAAVGASVFLLVSFFAWAFSGEDPQGSSSILALGSFIAALGFLAVIVVPKLREKSAIRNLRTDRSENGRLFVDQLRLSGKLTSEASPFVRANCAGAHLEGVDLHSANLHMVSLETADLQHANLCGANLRSAHLDGANLRDSDLRGANVWYATLHNADLRGAQLDTANLKAVDLSGAQLQGAVASGAHFDIYTTLPDDRKWTEEIDLAQYGIQS